MARTDRLSGLAGPGRLSAWTLLALSAPLCTVIIAVLMTFSLQQEEALRQANVRAFDARMHLQQLAVDAEMAESNLRAYLLTGAPVFRGAHQAARQALARDVAAELGRGELAERERRDFDALRREIDDKLDEMRVVMSLHDRQGVQAATQEVATGPGVREMARIRDSVQRLTDEEGEDVVRHRAETAVLRVQRTVLIGLLMLGMGLLVAAVLLAERRRGRDHATLLTQTQEAAARQEAILDSAMDAIVTLNPSGGIETVNAAAERLFGYSREDMLRRDFSMLIRTSPERRGTFLRRLATEEALRDGEVQHLTAERKDGAVFPVDVALGAMRLADGVHVVASLRDVSERRRIEGMKDEFISTVSHELRTPLTSIAGALGLLKGGAGGQLSERAGRLVELAEANSNRLVRLINDILDIEKIEAGKVAIDFKPLRLSELARNALEGMAGLAEKQGVTLEMESGDEEVGALGDADRLMQVLANLLSNAIKFSPVGGTVSLRIERLRDQARVSVTDQGPGVPESFRDKIFQKFAQADGADTRSHGGTGLGLAIAREIVRRHGGLFDFDSTPGQGATFWLELPSYDLEETQEAEPETRILICEDDVLAAEFLRDELEARGWASDAVHTASEARHALYAGRYAALLLDMHLPDSDGLTLLRALRQAPNTRRLPIIVVSGAIEGRQEAEQLGVVEWLDKPVNLMRLARAIQTGLSRRSGPAPLILHVDDDRDMLEVSRGLLGGSGEIVSANSLAAARRALDRARPDLVILDLGLPDGSGADLLAELVDAEGRRIPAIVYTAQEPEPGVADQVEAVLIKSRTTLPGLARLVRRLVEREEDDPSRKIAAV